MDDHLVPSAGVAHRDNEGLTVCDDGDMRDQTRVEDGVGMVAIGDSVFREASYARAGAGPGGGKCRHRRASAPMRTSRTICSISSK